MKDKNKTFKKEENDKLKQKNKENFLINKVNYSKIILCKSMIRNKILNFKIKEIN